MCLGIENASFHCGKAEDVLPELIKTETSNEVIGILDPPRGGIGEGVWSDWSGGIGEGVWSDWSGGIGEGV